MTAQTAMQSDNFISHGGSSRPPRALDARILVVEDDPDLREALADTLELAGCDVEQAESGEMALERLALRMVDMVVSDVNMGGMDGHQLLQEIGQQYPQIPVLLITAYGSISNSVDAIRNGAVDYLVKPFKPQVLVDTVRKYVSFQLDQSAEEPVAEDLQSKQVLQLAQRVASTDSTVLICGESGTGKEVLARYVHCHSSRVNGPFVAINCAAIPENMLEAMLFGHEKGAFTGAYSSAPGKFEQANGGTLLLDEISEMDVGLQAKLLRVIQEREVERLGGRKTIELDVRIIATTNRHLHEEVAAGKFREDLYYRLSVFPLQWMPLRERPKDILPLAQRLISQHAIKMNRGPVSFDVSAQQSLLNHSWPGNIRELDNVMQRALIMQGGSIISEQHLRLDPYQQAAILAMQSAAKSPLASPPVSRPLSSFGDDPQDLPIDTALVGFNDDSSASALGDDLKQREFEIILDVLKEERGSRKLAAERLGISPRTLRYKLAKIREAGIDVDQALISA
jgi:two-component system response regulator FlrC